MISMSAEFICPPRMPKGFSRFLRRLRYVTGEITNSVNTGFSRFLRRLRYGTGEITNSVDQFVDHGIILY